MRAKTNSETILIWKRWHPECKDEPKKQVDRRRSKIKVVKATFNSDEK